MTSLAELKAKSKTNLEKFKEKSKAPAYESKKDDRYWYPKRDDAGNGFAIIRFLPVSKIDDNKEEALPWVKIYSHSFQNEDTQKWYIENSLTTFNEKDPLSELNSKLWNQGDSGKEQATKQKRKLSYISNVYIVKDALNPENEGKVFLYSYGKKIYDKILALMNPDETYGEEPVDPFNFWTGRNFRMKIKSVKSGNSVFPNYDASEWDSISPISDKQGKPLSDEQIMSIWESEHSLLELLDRKHFKTYDELKSRLNSVLYGTDHVGEPKEETKSQTSSQTKNTVQSKKKEVELPIDDDDISKLINSSDKDDTDALIDEWISEDD